VSKEVTVSSSTFTPQAGSPGLAASEGTSVQRTAASLWGMWIVTGIAWLGVNDIVRAFRVRSARSS
jgi:hypothetical protein